MSSKQTRPPGPPNQTHLAPTSQTTLSQPTPTPDPPPTAVPQTPLASQPTPVETPMKKSGPPIVKINLPPRWDQIPHGTDELRKVWPTGASLVDPHALKDVFGTLLSMGTPEIGLEVVAWMAEIISERKAQRIAKLQSAAMDRKMELEQARAGVAKAEDDVQRAEAELNMALEEEAKGKRKRDAE